MHTRKHPGTLANWHESPGSAHEPLQRSFERSGQPSPMLYLRRLRLQRVHTELAANSPDSVTVTMVAGRCGFMHLGRFAGQYRQLFGETPSQTLRAPGTPSTAFLMAVRTGNGPRSSFCRAPRRPTDTPAMTDKLREEVGFVAVEAPTRMGPYRRDSTRIGQCHDARRICRRGLVCLTRLDEGEGMNQ
jgi:AraC-like DNA-binding protein